MKNIKEFINEAMFETKTWTYLCIGYTKGIDFFHYNNWDPHEVSRKIDDKYVIVNTNKDLNTNKTPIISAWKRKYNEEIKDCGCLLTSYGSLQLAKYIKAIDKLIKTEKATLADVFKYVQEYDGKLEGCIEYVYNKLKNQNK